MFSGVPSQQIDKKNVRKHNFSAVHRRGRKKELKKWKLKKKSSQNVKFLTTDKNAGEPQAKNFRRQSTRNGLLERRWMKVPKFFSTKWIMQKASSSHPIKSPWGLKISTKIQNQRLPTFLHFPREGEFMVRSLKGIMKKKQFGSQMRNFRCLLTQFKSTSSE